MSKFIITIEAEEDGFVISVKNESSDPLLKYVGSAAYALSDIVVGLKFDEAIALLEGIKQASSDMAMNLKQTEELH